MRSFVPAIYDVTVAIPKSSPPPTMLRLFTGQSSVVSFFFLIKKLHLQSSVFSWPHTIQNENLLLFSVNELYVLS